MTSSRELSEADGGRGRLDWPPYWDIETYHRSGSNCTEQNISSHSHYEGYKECIYSRNCIPTNRMTTISLLPVISLLSCKLSSSHSNWLIFSPRSHDSVSCQHVDIYFTTIDLTLFVTNRLSWFSNVFFVC